MQVPEVGDDMSNYEANAKPIGNQDMNEVRYIIYTYITYRLFSMRSPDCYLTKLREYDLDS